MASLCRYHSAAEQPPHEHDYATVSLLLVGALAEDVGRRSFELDRRRFGFKPPGCQHSDRWGAEGGLMFTLKLDGEGADDLERRLDAGWSAAHVPADAVPLIRLCLFSASASRRQEAAADFLSLLENDLPASSGRPPRWLDQAREQIDDNPRPVRIAEAAAAAGVHRAHFTQMFRAHFGVPPSVYRQRSMVRRAFGALMATSEPLDAIAADCGFADQSHMTRAFSVHAGLPPGVLRRLLNA